MLAAAGVAYYALLALVPALVAVVALFGLLAERDDVRDQLAPLTDALPSEAADLLVAQLESVTEAGQASTTVGLVLGLVGVLWLLSNAVNALVIGIRLAHERQSPHNWVQGRWFALRLSLAAVVVTTIMLWLVVALPRLLDLAELGDTLDGLIRILRWPTVLGFTAVSIGALYRSVLGRRTASLLPITAGVLSATGVWVGGTAVMTLFASEADRLADTFGTLGAVAVLLVWLYVTALAVLLGAEIDAALHTGRHRTGPIPVRDTAPPPG